MSPKIDLQLHKMKNTNKEYSHLFPLLVYANKDDMLTNVLHLHVSDSSK